MHQCRRSHHLLPAALSLLLWSATSSAQTPSVRSADSIIARALDRARAGDTSTALRELSLATRVAPRYAVAHFQRGILLERSTSLGMSDILRRREASNEIKEALELDAGNPLYLMELGRLRAKTPFLRLDAERLFNRALDAAIKRNDARVLAEVRWELGQIHDRRYGTMANRRMVTNPGISFDVTEAISDWHYTADFFGQWSQPVPNAGELDFDKAEELYRAALDADSTHLGATVGLLGLLLEARRYEEMISVAQALRHAQPAEPRLLLALGLAYHRLDREADAGFAFDTAIGLLPSAERREMLGLERVLRREAAAEYGALGDTGRSTFEALYWDVADPLRLTPVNEAHVEFLARVAHADLRFSSPEFHMHGWQTDRGTILIRYGQPPMVGTLSPETQEIHNSEAIARITTVWWYPESKLRFIFVGPPAFDVQNFAGDFRAYAENARHLTPIRFDNLRAGLPIDSVPVQVARFRGDRPGLTDVSLFADLPAARLLRGSDVQQATLETGLFISDVARHTVVEARDSAIVRLEKPDAVSSRSWHRALRPGEYLYRVEARQGVSGRSARGLSAMQVIDFPPGRLELSDVLVARRIAPLVPGTTPRRRSDLLINPNGSLAFARSDTMFLYWETYGLTGDSNRVARVHIDLSLRVDKIQRQDALVVRIIGGLLDATGLSAKGDERVTLSYDKVVSLDGTDRTVDYLALNLGEAPEGVYTLQLSVKDLVTQRTVTQQRVVQVRQP
ncbi:MAG: GWxTD domain-containing protein [Gemmatimonadaceae bacterium]